MTRLFYLLAIPFLVGCTHTINYKLGEKDRWTGAKINGVLYVQTFPDKTSPIVSKEEHIGKATWRTNYRKGYANTNISSSVTAMIAKHLAYSGLFSKVVSGTETNADYFLSGTLSDFQTRGKVNSTAENIQAASAGFGVLGAIVGAASTAGMKSEIGNRVALDDLKLTDKPGQILWHDSITISNNLVENFEAANQAVLFNYTDQALKEAVNEMIQRLGKSSLTKSPATAAK